MLYEVGSLQISSEPGHINFVVLAVFYGFMRGLVGYVKIQSGRDRGVITEESVGMMDLMNGQLSEVMNRSRVWPNL